MCIWSRPNSNWVQMGYAESFTTVGDSSKVYAPDSAYWGSSVWVSKAYPFGDSRAAHGSSIERQTKDDIVLYVLHDSGPGESPTDETITAWRTESQHIVGYTLRNENGIQYHYDQYGNLRYVDKNWRNNVAPGTAGHVDDYIEVTWLPSTRSLADDESVRAIDRVIAPPSDGRYLVFHHPLVEQEGTLYTCSHVTSISMSTGLTTYSGLVQYEYIDEANTEYLYESEIMSKGALWRVKSGTDATRGLQYDYGNLTTSTASNEFIHAPQLYGRDICLKSWFDEEEDTVDAFLANLRYKYEHTMIQYMRDPNGDHAWRKFMRISEVPGRRYCQMLCLSPRRERVLRGAC